MFNNNLHESADSAPMIKYNYEIKESLNQFNLFLKVWSFKFLLYLPILYVMKIDCCSTKGLYNVQFYLIKGNIFVDKILITYWSFKIVILMELHLIKSVIEIERIKLSIRFPGQLSLLFKNSNNLLN